MKKIAFLSLLLIGILIAGCKKEQSNGQKQLGSYYFGTQTSHYPMNSTLLPQYKFSGDTINLTLYLSGRSYVYDPPKSLGLDYYYHETDQTEFRNSDFGLYYYSFAGTTLDGAGDNLLIDWYGVKDNDAIYQRYSMDFIIPIDSNEFNSEMFIYDSLLISDRWYQKVLTGPVNKSFQPGLDYSGAIPEKFYYSTEYGIIKFEMSDGNHWEIINEE